MRVGYFVFDSSGKQDYVGVTDRTEMSYEDVISVTSANLGNLAFKYAARRLFEDPVVYVTYRDDPAWVRDNVDVLVLPEANLVNPSVNYQGPANFLRKVGKPVLLCGVGSQATIDVNAADFPELPAGTIAFLRAASELTPTIFVRGEFTGDVLRRYGIENSSPVGCPSLLINEDPQLWSSFEGGNSNREVMGHLAVTEGVYAVSKRTDRQDAVEKFLFDLVRFRDAVYVGQTQISVLRYGLGFPADVVRTNAVNTVRYLAPGLPAGEAVEILRKKARAFARIDEWISFLRGRTGVIGSRIHGNMMGIQAGTPSLPVVHDMRLRELTRAMAMPSVELNDVRGLQRVDEVNDLFDEHFFSSDFSTADRRRRAIAAEYADAAREIGLTPSSHLLGLT